MQKYQWRLSVKYDPSQPRVPEGQSGGGQWTSGAGGLADATIPDGYASWRDEETITGNAIIELPEGLEPDKASVGKFLAEQMANRDSPLASQLYLEGPQDIDEVEFSQFERSGGGRILQVRFQAIVSDEAMERRQGEIGAGSEWEVETGVGGAWW